ncbi:MAG: hypothetical protein ACO1OX_01825 [Novosphingobium sp.]
MRANFHCPNEDLVWQRRYFFTWIALVLYGCLAFALGESGALALTAQGLFFVAAFSLIVWPVCAAFQSDCDRHGRPRKAPGS